MEPKSSYVRLSEEKPGVVRVTLDRAAKLNALDLAVMEEITLILEGLENRADVRVVIVDSAGDKAFIAGADIAQMSQMSALDFRHYSNFMRRQAKVMTSSEKVYIAAVKGVAFGGGNIFAMNCDLVFATPTSRFGQQEIDLGILGGLPRLMHLIGPRKAWDMVLTGRTVSAQEAEDMGLITKCVPAEEYDQFLDAYVDNIISRSEVAIRLSKVLKQASENIGLETAYGYENELISLCFDAADTKRRLTEFAERTSKKRPAKPGA